METSRLILRPFESGDVEAAFGWFSDPTVMRFSPTGPDTSLKQTKARLTNYQQHQTAHDFSRWIILDRRLGRGAVNRPDELTVRSAQKPELTTAGSC